MYSRRPSLLVLSLAGALCAAPKALADDFPEYHLKTAFLYNFVQFTEWPADVGKTLNVCIHGRDPFAKNIDALQGKAVGARSIAVQRRRRGSSLAGCQVVFIATSAMDDLPRLLTELGNDPVLTVSDTPGAARRGVALNMTVKRNRITFESNLAAARAVRLNLSSKLLRLAKEVYQ